MGENWDEYLQDLAFDQRELFMDGFEAAMSVVKNIPEAEILLHGTHSRYLKLLRQPRKDD